MKNTILFTTFSLLILFGSSSLAQNKVVVIPMASDHPFKGDLYQTISNAAFSPNSNLVPWERPVFITTYGYLEPEETLTAFTAPVILPDGSTVSQLSTYMEDTGINCTMTFAKHALSDHQITVISNATDSANIATGLYAPIHVDIANEIIDNQNFQYHLTWACTGIGSSADRLYAARIKYRIQ